MSAGDARLACLRDLHSNSSRDRSRSMCGAKEKEPEADAICRFGGAGHGRCGRTIAASPNLVSDVTGRARTSALSGLRGSPMPGGSAAKTSVIYRLDARKCNNLLVRARYSLGMRISPVARPRRDAKSVGRSDCSQDIPRAALLSWLVRCPTFSLDTRHSSPTGPASARALLSSFRSEIKRVLSLSLSLPPHACPTFSLLRLSLISLLARLLSSRLISSLASSHRRAASSLLARFACDASQPP